MNISDGFYRGKRILVTGHSGFVGWWLCRALKKAGAETVGYSIDIPTSSIQLGDSDEIKSIIGDVRNKEDVERVFEKFKPEFVFHLAAQTSKAMAIEDPVYTYQTNVIGTLNVLEASRKSSSVKSIVIASTSKVYQNREWCWAYRENDKQEGAEPLSDSKACCESIAKSYLKTYFNGFNSAAVSIARFDNVFGGGNNTSGKLIADCVNAVKQSKVIEYRQSSSVRPYLHVLDLIKGLLLLGERQREEKRFEGEYNFGPEYDQCPTTSNLVMMFCKEWGEDVSSRLCAPMDRVEEERKIRLDIAKSKNGLLWSPHWDTRQAIKKLVEWEKKVTKGTSADEITNKQIGEFFGD